MNHLERCLSTMKEGFHEVMRHHRGESGGHQFCLSGPADYRKGIIGDLNNLPAFREEFPSEKHLEEEFGLSVMNNDGDLFAYGEALGGILLLTNAANRASGVLKIPEPFGIHAWYRFRVGLN